MYEWEHGRELASMSTGSTTWTFTYDANGMRTRRTNGTLDYRYVYNGSSLSRLTVGNNTLYFAYSADGTPMTVTYNGTTYYYVTNIQGDVIAILNSAGNPVVTYTYDAWGNPLSTTGSMATTLGTHNPLRYRGYVYDQETQLYYLQSRYYNPQIGRFINADGYVSTGQGVLGNNMFAYCGNNPVVRKDISGYGWKEIWEWIENAYERITGVQQQQQMVNNQILQQQTEMISNAITDVYEHATNIQEQTQTVNTQILQEQIEIASDATDALWDAYMRGYNLQQEAQLKNSTALVDGAKWCFNNPEETIDLALAAGGVSSVLYNVGIAAVTGNPVTGVVGATVVAIWGIYRAIKGALS